MPATCPMLHCQRPAAFWGTSMPRIESHTPRSVRHTEPAVCGPASTTKKQSVKGTKPASQNSSSKSSTAQSTKGLRTTKGYRQAPSQKLQGRTGPGGFLQRFYIQFTGFPFPLGPLLFRQTFRYEVVPGTMWTFEQMQTLALSSVATTVRMTIVKLASGGLWIHSPIAPTRECVALINELEAPVEFIILPTYAYEHKVFVAPMSRKYPQAKVYTSPSQWTVPLQLPPQLLGIFAEGTLQDNDTAAPWSAEIEQKVFESSIGLKPYVEVAFFHKASKTLLVTDALINISPEAPEVIKDGDLYAAGGPLPLPVLVVCNGGEYLNRLSNPPPPEDADERRMLGWKRNALQVNYFAPWDLLQPDPSFLSMVNRVLVPPILQTLVFSAAPEETKRWVDDIVSSWDFTSVIPCHFAGPVPSSPQAVKTAFAFAFEGAERAAPAKAGGLFGFVGSLFRAAPVNAQPQLPLHDFRALLGIQNILKRTRVLNSTPLNQGRPE